ncbi:hypothetical protein JCM14124_19420 [Humidesulfovibrio idahonensis]
MKLSFTLNGRAVRLDVAPDRRAIDVLREDLRGAAAAPPHAAPCAQTPEASTPGQGGLDASDMDASGMDASCMDASCMDASCLEESCMEERALDVKEGCGTGECGACSILVDGVQKLSCLMLAAQLHGRKVVTAAGLGTPEAPHPIQRAFAEHGAVQCGFCTPGMVVAAASLLAANPAPGREDIRRALSGNLCRCTGYVKIVDAVEAAAKAMRHELHGETREDLASPGRGAPAGPEPHGGSAPVKAEAAK